MRTIHFQNWKVCGYHNCVPALGQSVELGTELIGSTLEMDAAVPGSVYQDLERAGYIASPHYDMNSLACEWVANRWWVYRATVPAMKKAPGKRYRLVLEGIDYEGDILFNGVELGTQTGMFLRFERDVTGLLREDTENLLVVRLHHAPFEYGQIGYTSRVAHLKSRFNYKWDFSTRLVNIGIYGDVYLEEDNGVRITQADIRPVEGDVWDLNARFTLAAEGDREAKAFLALYDGDTCVMQTAETLRLHTGDNDVAFHPPVHNPRRWYPNGHGEAAVYRLRLRLSDKNGELDGHDYTVGFRTVSYRRADGAGEEALPYMPVINGKPIYIKGLNFVPMNLLPGCTRDEDYHSMLRKIRNAGVNLLRVWGGGVVECELFYELCDRCGIMVWQEFPLSSSGGDNVASKVPAFVEKLREASLDAILLKRNHVSLTFWSGGNELCDEAFIDQPDRNDHPAGFNDSTIAMLRELVETYHPGILMLPTSASGPLEFLDLGRPGENHDVHGPWQYGGVKVHYEIYNRSDSMLHSEFGCDGMSCYESLPKFLPPEHLTVAKNTREDLSWRHHGGEWWDTYPVREKKLFGEFAPDELQNLIKCSQFLQAEGIRYAVQANRRRQFKNVGSILWQCNEPWPNICCTTVMDYYQNEKLAYYFLADAYRPLDASLRYDSISWMPGETFIGRLALANDGAAAAGRLRCVLHAAGKERVLADEWVTAPENNAAEQMEVSFGIGADFGDSFVIEVSFEADGAERVKNDYLFLIPNKAGMHAREAVSGYYDRLMAGYKADARFQRG